MKTGDVNTCDRCSKKLPTKALALRGTNAAGLVINAADLCEKCYREVWAFALAAQRKGARK